MVRILGGLLVLLVIGIVLFGWWSGGSADQNSMTGVGKVTAQAPVILPVRKHYEPVADRHFKAPVVEEVELPRIGRTDVSWGSVGNDNQGNVYVGLAESYGEPRSAHFVQVTKEGLASDLGDVLSELKRALIGPASQSQGKIHSQIVQANDGYLYFASFDEAGETDVRLPEYGGHLWRFDISGKRWEHLLATPEALIAVNTDGHFVYALGYWGHVLYQYDTQTGAVKKEEVGSVPGHVSRQFLVDGKGHVYVPKVSQSGINEEPEAVLVEYDRNLSPIAEYALADYQSKNMARYRGIIAYTNMKNGDVYFTLGQGYLLQIQANEAGIEKLVNHGLFNPAGESNIPSLFTVDGEQFVMAASRRTDEIPEWLIYEKISGVTVNYEMPALSDFLFFGTEAKDTEGNFYLVGQDTRTRQPKVVKLTFPEE